MIEEWDKPRHVWLNKEAAIENGCAIYSCPNGRRIIGCYWSYKSFNGFKGDEYMGDAIGIVSHVPKGSIKHKLIIASNFKL